MHQHPAWRKCKGMPQIEVTFEVDVKNKLKTYIYNMKNTINKEKVESTLKEALEWWDDIGNEFSLIRSYDLILL